MFRFQTHDTANILDTFIPRQGLRGDGAPSWIRTKGLVINSHSLPPTELTGQVEGDGLGLPPRRTPSNWRIIGSLTLYNLSHLFKSNYVPLSEFYS